MPNNSIQQQNQAFDFIEKDENQAEHENPGRHSIPQEWLFQFEGMDVENEEKDNEDSNWNFNPVTAGFTFAPDEQETVCLPQLMILMLMKCLLCFKLIKHWFFFFFFALSQPVWLFNCRFRVP